MAPPRRTTLIIGTVAITALAFILLLVQSGRYPNPPQVLPDGSILTLVRVDYGKTNELVEGTSFQKAFRRFIPKSGTNIFGYHIKAPKIFDVPQSAQDQLVFWLRRTVPAGKSVSPFVTWQPSSPCSPRPPSLMPTQGSR